MEMVIIVFTLLVLLKYVTEDTSIDQVFRNVRAEVLSETGGMQRPVEATQLTGQTFILRKDLSVLMKKISVLN